MLFNRNKINYNHIAYITIIILLVASCSKKKEAYTIKGKIAGNTTSKDVLLLDLKDSVINRAKVDNGTFLFTGSVFQPVRISIKGGGNFDTMVLENDSYEISISKNKIEITGGSINPLVNGYKNLPEYKRTVKERRELDIVFEGIDPMNKEKMTATRAVYYGKRHLLYRLKEDYQNKILSGDASTMVKFFTQLSFFEKDLEKEEKSFLAFKKQIGNHPQLLDKLKSIKKDKIRREKFKELMPGKPFKEVLEITKDGKEIKLSEIIENNTLVLLDFWASWCGPCRKEFPHLRKAYKKFHDKGFEIYAISLDKSKDTWLKALDEEDNSWINLINTEGFKAKSAEDYMVFGIPMNYLIDKNGIIVGKMLREWMLDEKLEEYYGSNLQVR